MWIINYDEQKRTHFEWITLGERKDERDMFTVVNQHKRCQWWLFHHAIQVAHFFYQLLFRKNDRFIDDTKWEWKRKKAMEWRGVTEKKREPDLSEYAQLYDRKMEGWFFLYFRTKAEVQVEETTELHQTRLCAHKSNQSSMTRC